MKPQTPRSSSHRLSHRWRLSKYDPVLRDEKGDYSLDEWTAVSDIGKTFDGAVLTEAAYLDIEGKYTEAILAFVRSAGLDGLDILDLCGPTGMTWEGSHTPSALVPIQTVVMEAQTRLQNESGVSPIPFDLTALTSLSRLSGETLEVAIRLGLRDVLWANLGVSDVLKVTFGYDYLIGVASSEDCVAAIDLAQTIGLFVETTDLF